MVRWAVNKQNIICISLHLPALAALVGCTSCFFFTLKRTPRQLHLHALRSSSTSLLCPSTSIFESTDWIPAEDPPLGLLRPSLETSLVRGCTSSPFPKSTTEEKRPSRSRPQTIRKSDRAWSELMFLYASSTPRRTEYTSSCRPVLRVISSPSANDETAGSPATYE